MVRRSPLICAPFVLASSQPFAALGHPGRAEVTIPTLPRHTAPQHRTKLSLDPELPNDQVRQRKGPAHPGVDSRR